MTAWAEAYERWYSAPFPRGHSIDEIDELKAHLALLDVYVMEAALPLNKGYSVAGARIDVPGALADYRQRTETLLATATDGRDRLLEYLEYLEHLEEM